MEWKNYCNGIEGKEWKFQIFIFDERVKTFQIQNECLLLLGI